MGAMSFLRKFVRRTRPVASIAGYENQSFAGERETLERLAELVGLHAGFVVDIAASDGVSQSSTIGFFASSGWRGLAVEMDPQKFSKLAQTYAAFELATLARTRVTPSNVACVLEAFEVPKNFSVLNLDIDSYDLRVLEACLQAGYKPSVVTMEINEKVPAGVFFTVEYDAEHFWQGDHFYGCSVDAASEIVKPYGYILWKVQYNNAFFVDSSVCTPGMTDLPAGMAWKSGYRDAPNRRELFSYNSDVEHWLELEPEAAVATIRDFYSDYEGKYSIRVT
jgi:hypothetical protein